MLGTAADYEPFARGALPSYGLEQATLTLLSFSENATYLADTGGEQVVVRVHRPGYNTLEAVESELAWVEAVRTSSTVRTPSARRALDGRNVVPVAHGDDVRLVDVMEFVPGVGAEDAASGISYEDLGAITATLHHHVQSWTPPTWFTRFRWDLDSMLGAEGRWGNWRDVVNLTESDRDVIETAETRVRHRLESFGTTPDRFGLVHADLRMSNLIVSDDGIVVIDFDDCGWSWFLTDLAAVITWDEAAPSSPAIIEQWLRGYFSVSELEPAALEEIPTFIMLRRLMVTAWIGTHPESDPAVTLGARFAAETAQVAKRYLEDPTWFAYTRDQFDSPASQGHAADVVARDVV